MFYISCFCLFVSSRRRKDIILSYFAIFRFSSLLFKLQYKFTHWYIQDGSIEFILALKRYHFIH